MVDFATKSTVNLLCRCPIPDLLHQKVAAGTGTETKSSWPDLIHSDAVSTEERTRRRQVSIRLVPLVGSIPAQGRGRRDSLVRLVLVDEEGVEAAEGGGRRHRPDDDLDGQRHDFSDFIAEHDGEEAGERPDRRLDRLAVRRVIVQIFINS